LAGYVVITRSAKASPLVAEGPDEYSVAPRGLIPAEELGAMSGRADAHLGRELIGIAAQQRREDLAQHPVNLDRVLADPRPHRRDRVGKPGAGSAARFELLGETSTGDGEVRRRRV
jgi:hypothetical protein